MTQYRTEKDLLGARQIPAQALHGIHTLRACENFPLAQRPINPTLIHAFGAVKLACARTNQEITPWPDNIFAAIETACAETADAKLDKHIIVDALQGGAGTSTNMNVNEVIANRALQILQLPLGDYKTVSPLDDINRHQSTNDTYPTALKVAALNKLADLERNVVALLEAFQEKEKQFADIVKIGRTQMQDAVLTTLGREMSAYAEAISRDRWRIYKCHERLRTVNLGGTAIGTALGAPRQYVFRVVEHLRDITSLGLARAENLVEATQNTDVFVEVSGILKALAANLLKIATDLRFLSSGPTAGLNEINLPPKQAGSSIMPGKVNPVIPEAVSQAAIAVMAHDQTIAHASSLGNLELNAFMPIIADALLDSIDLLSNACNIFRVHCITDITANRQRCQNDVHNATASVTALLATIGYQAATQLACDALTQNKSIRTLAIERNLLTAQQFDELTSPENVTRLGSPTPTPTSNTNES